MSNFQKLYWLTRLDGIKALFITVGCIGIFILGAFALYLFVEGYFDEDYGDEKMVKRFKRLCKWVIPIALVLFTTSILIPSKNEAIIIYAGGKTMDFIDKDSSVNKLPQQTTKYISDYLDSKIKEVKEK